MPNLNTTILSSLPFVRPPLGVQRAIAHILGTLDDKIELNRRMNETLEAMARAIFQSWFVDFDPVRAKASGESADSICQRLGLTPELLALFPDSFEDSELREIPAGWTNESIGTLAKVTGGSTPNTKEPKYWGNGIHYWATPKDLSRLSSPVLLETERKVSDEGLAQIGSGMLNPGTVLLSSRAPIGYRAINEVPVAVNQGFIAMTPNLGISKYFLLYWAEWAHDEIVSRANGSTFLEISKANFRPIPVVRPTDALFEKFDQYVEPLYKRIVADEQEIRILMAQRDSLLPRLLSGEVRVVSEEVVS
jgi:type I restriction enzyme S subunit